MKRGDVKIEQVGNELLISGEFKERQRKGVIRRQTRRVGKFAYRVALPEQIDADKIEAKLDNGVLAVACRRRSARNDGTSRSKPDTARRVGSRAERGA